MSGLPRFQFRPSLWRRYDNYVESDLAAFAAFENAARRIAFVIGPWPHNMSIPFAGVRLARIRARRFAGSK